MIGKLLDLSGKIDDRTVEVLDVVTNVAASLNIPFFVVGATARDIVLGHGFGVEIIRATVDIDLAVQVSSWEQYGEEYQNRPHWTHEIVEEYQNRPHWTQMPRH